jgi:hypothetical protein
MSYTYKALTLVWLIVFGLAALSGSGMIAGSWILLLVVAALVLPALTLALCSKPSALTTAQRRALVVGDDRDRSPLGAAGIDVENDGGARRTHFGGGAPEPVHVVR